MESARKLDEHYFYNEEERKIKFSSIIKFYIEIVDKYNELADEYKVPLFETFSKLRLEFVN